VVPVHKEIGVISQQPDVKDVSDFPSYVRYGLDSLAKNGYEAYVIGGAVRDLLLGKTPSDYDVTTNATPEEVERVFGKENCVETGMLHGTVTLVVDHHVLEITTYRVDGLYMDGRHPTEVSYTKSLQEDVKRRDFTMNALAMSVDGRIIDFVEGQKDLENHIIRAVGDAGRRFTEDALRILRALRFASQLGFEIEEETRKAIFAHKEKLLALKGERIRAEWDKLLCGEFAHVILDEYYDVITVIFPELRAMKGFLQYNPHHIYDVWEHTLVAVDHVPANAVLKITMIFHDCGKPDCFRMDEQGVGHFLGHQKKSADMAKGVVERLKYDRDTKEKVLFLIAHHDCELIPTKNVARRRLGQYGEEYLRLLLSVKRADMAAHSEKSAYRFDEIAAFEKQLDAIIAAGDCVNVNSLAISGNDLMDLGMKPGPEIGRIKNMLLEAIINDEVANEKDALVAKATDIIRENTRRT